MNTAIVKKERGSTLFCRFFEIGLFFNHHGSEADMEELAKTNPSSNDTDGHG
jgi:hypothetical protein